MPKLPSLKQVPDPLGPSHSSTEELAGNPLASCPVCGQNGANNWLRAPDRFHGRSKIYELARCSACSLVWLKDPPPPSEIGRHYGSDYDRAIASGGAGSKHWNGRRDEVLSYKPSGSILDLGCGSGGFLATLKGPLWKLSGVEMSEAAAREAEAGCGAQVFVGDILDAPFPHDSFDVVTCFHVFEHLYEPLEVLTRVSDWLKPGGVFYTMMPNIDSAGCRIFGSYWYALELPRHLYHFSPVTLRALANAVGLWEVSVTTHRELFVEASVRYLVDEGLRRIGFRRAPLAQDRTPILPRRVARKVFRLTGLPILTGLASFVGDGESIHAVFRKADRLVDVEARA